MKNYCSIVYQLLIGEHFDKLLLPDASNKARKPKNTIILPSASIFLCGRLEQALVLACFSLPGKNVILFMSINLYNNRTLPGTKITEPNAVKPKPCD